MNGLTKVHRVVYDDKDTKRIEEVWINFRYVVIAVPGNDGVGTLLEFAKDSVIAARLWHVTESIVDFELAGLLS